VAVPTFGGHRELPYLKTIPSYYATPLGMVKGYKRRNPEGGWVKLNPEEVNLIREELLPFEGEISQWMGFWIVVAGILETPKSADFREGGTWQDLCASRGLITL
jgi:hypothetical protein